MHCLVTQKPHENPRKTRMTTEVPTCNMYWSCGMTVGSEIIRTGNQDKLYVF